MGKKVAMGFEPESVSIAVRDILPLKQVSATVKASRKYRQIAAAIRTAGIRWRAFSAASSRSEASYGPDHLHLTLAIGYVRTWPWQRDHRPPPQ